MIRFHLTAEDLAETRFAFSPVWEVVMSYAAVCEPSKNVFHLPWMKAHRDQIAKLDLSPLTALLPENKGYLPDFVIPPPEGPYPEFEEELARIVATPEEEVAREVELAYDGLAMPPAARRYIDEPEAALRDLTATLRWYFSVAIEPHWPRLRALLEGDVLYRARTLALEGAEALFRDLHPSVRWNDGVLTIDKRWDLDVKPEGRGVLLIPLAFACPRLTVVTEPPWQPTIAYPPRGLANLWEADHAPTGKALEELVGQNRAAILRALEIPMTTSEVAARVGVTPGAVSQQLAVLRRAGVVEANRSGRGVYSSLTPLGAQLVGLLER